MLVRSCVCVRKRERGGGRGGDVWSVWTSESKQVNEMRGANVAAAGGRVWRREKMKNARLIKSERKREREREKMLKIRPEKIRRKHLQAQ